MILTIVGSSVGSVLFFLAVCLVCRWRRKERALRIARRTQTNIEILAVPGAAGNRRVDAPVSPGITKEGINARFPVI